MPRAQVVADPAVLREHGRERDAGHGGRQRERHVDERIDDLAARELVAHQRPGEDEAEHQVDGGGQQRGTERQPVGAQGARAQDDVQRTRRQLHEAAMSTSAASGSSTMAHRKKVVKPKVSPKPGSTLGCVNRPHGCRVRCAITTAPASAPGASSAAKRCQARDVRDTEYQHLIGRFARGGARAPAATSPKRSSVRISRPWTACASERASSSARMPCGRGRRRAPARCRRTRLRPTRAAAGWPPPPGSRGAPPHPASE